MFNLLRQIASVVFVAVFFIPITILAFLPGFVAGTFLFWLISNSTLAPSTEFETTLVSLITLGFSIFIALKTPYGNILLRTYNWYSETASNISGSSDL